MVAPEASGVVTFEYYPQTMKCLMKAMAYLCAVEWEVMVGALVTLAVVVDQCVV
jgi:hypothetical protein